MRRRKPKDLAHIPKQPGQCTPEVWLGEPEVPSTKRHEVVGGGPGAMNRRFTAVGKLLDPNRVPTTSHGLAWLCQSDRGAQERLGKGRTAVSLRCIRGNSAANTKALKERTASEGTRSNVGVFVDR